MGLVYLPTFSHKNQPNVCECYHTWILNFGSPGCEISEPLPKLPSPSDPRQSNPVKGSPNFELVADILDWLLHRFEPGIAIPDDISISANFFRKKKHISWMCFFLWFNFNPHLPTFFDCFFLRVVS